jgi:CHAD domain-containing protein
MTLSASLSNDATSKCIGLDLWMDRVLENAQKVQKEWDADDIHDLRAALRRCRTMADALEEVNPTPGWRKLKKASRPLFHTLGCLRDAQVERFWVKKLGTAGDPLRRHVLALLSCQERRYRKDAQQALARFDRKDWRKLSRRLSPKSRFFPLESVVFQRLALARLNEAVALYQQARRRRSSIAWHRLRIAIKRFRYTVENFLPHRYEVWADDLKRMQDLLGDVHDLDVLRGEIRRNASALNASDSARWRTRIETEREARLQEFLAKTNDKNSPWIAWRAGFQWGHALVAPTLPVRWTA